MSLAFRTVGAVCTGIHLNHIKFSVEFPQSIFVRLFAPVPDMSQSSRIRADVRRAHILPILQGIVARDSFILLFLLGFRQRRQLRRASILFPPSRFPFRTRLRSNASFPGNRR